MFQAKLAAGGVDVGAFALANGGRDARLVEDFDKRPQSLGRRIVNSLIPHIK